MVGEVVLFQERWTLQDGKLMRESTLIGDPLTSKVSVSCLLAIIDAL